MWCGKTLNAVMMTFMFALLLAIALPAVAQIQGPMMGEQGKGASGLIALSIDQGVLGKNIETGHGENVGTIDDVIFNRWGGIARYLVEVNPFQGLGEKIVALNPDQVRFTGQDHVLFNGTRADLESLPAVNPYEYGLYHGYYGPYDQGPREQYQQGGWQGRQSYQQPYPPRSYYGRGQGSIGQSPGTQREGMRWFMGRGISSDDFLSAQVFDPQRNLIGEVEDLVLDPRSNRVTNAVIGVGNKQVLVPLRQLRYAGGDSVIYRGTEGQLEQMPEYEVGEGGRVTTPSSAIQQKAGSGAKAGSVPQPGVGGQAQTQEKKSGPQQR